MEEATTSPFSQPPLDEDIRIEAATIIDLPELAEILSLLFDEEEDFEANLEKQERGLRLILEEPNRGRIFVLRNNHKIIAMVNLLFTISTAEGGFVVLMEDVVVRPEHRRVGYGAQLVQWAINYAREKRFLRITLLTDQISAASQSFFQKIGFRYSNMIPMRYPLNS